MDREKTEEELKLEKEKQAEKDIKVVKVMIHMYCKSHHHPDGYLCDECQELLDYVKFRRSKCPWGKDKPFCAHCPIQCYKPVMKERIVKVMRYSGPRITFTHPILALKHIVESIIYQIRKALGIAPKMPPKKVKPKTDKPVVKTDKAPVSEVKKSTETLEANDSKKVDEDIKVTTINVEEVKDQTLTDINNDIDNNEEADKQSKAAENVVE